MFIWHSQWLPRNVAGHTHIQFEHPTLFILYCLTPNTLQYKIKTHTYTSNKQISSLHWYSYDYRSSWLSRPKSWPTENCAVWISQWNVIVNNTPLTYEAKGWVKFLDTSYHVQYILYLSQVWFLKFTPQVLLYPTMWNIQIITHSYTVTFCGIKSEQTFKPVG